MPTIAWFYGITLHVQQLALIAFAGVIAFQIPLAKLPPGQYVSQINVIDETGRKFAFPRSEIVSTIPEKGDAQRAPLICEARTYELLVCGLRIRREQVFHDLKGLWCDLRRAQGTR